MSPTEKAALRKAFARRPRGELKALFALVRAHNDRALFAAMSAPAKKAAKPKGDPLVRDLRDTMRPILGPAAEKADLLIEHMAKKHRRRLDYEPKGLADAARCLRKHFKDEQIRSGAVALVAHLEKLHSARETVV